MNLLTHKRAFGMGEACQEALASDQPLPSRVFNVGFCGGTKMLTPLKIAALFRPYCFGTLRYAGRRLLGACSHAFPLSGAC